MHHATRFRSSTVAAATCCLAVSTALAGCSGSAGAEKNSGAYLVGMTGDFSAGLAVVGQNWRDGAQAHFDYVNANGGINGHQVKFVALDDASDATRAVANTKQLMGQDESAQFVFTAAASVATGPLLTQSETPAIVEAVVGSQLEPVQPQIFAGDVVISDEAGPAVAFAKAEFDAPDLRVAVLTAQSAVLDQFANAAASLVKANGWELVARQAVSLSAPTAAPQATAVAAAQPDVIIMSLQGAQAVSAVKTLRAAGVDAPVVNYHVGGNYTLLKQLNDPNYYVLAATPYINEDTENLQGVATYLKAAKAAGLDPNAGLAMSGYVQAYVLTQALKACGYPCAPADMTAALNGLSGLDLGGVTFGPWSYSKENHTGITKEAVFHWDPEKNAPVQVSHILTVGND
jgi:branched-chain amino acid transport system substrate-binding protein